MRERRRARALRQAGHGGGEVAAAELGWGGVARGGGIQRGEEWGQGVAGVPRGAVGEAGAGLRPSSAGGAELCRRR